MYCFDEREIAFHILPFSFKMVCTMPETISKSLHICAFDFTCLSTAFIIITSVLIVMRFLLLAVFIDMEAMRWQLRMRVKTKI